MGTVGTVATYHRASREDEEFSDEDIEVFDLVGELLEAAALRGVEMHRGPIYVDDPTAVRLAFARMREDAEAGKFQVLVVYRLEHLCRTPRDLEQLRSELQALGVELVSCVVPATSTPATKVGRPAAEFDVLYARELRRRGKTFKEISTELGVGVATLHRALRAKRPRPQQLRA